MLGLFGACAAGPNYERPKVSLPATYRFEGPAGAASLADLPWWQVFRDQDLRALVEEALRNNFDLLIATSRVDAARAQARSAGAQLLPGISVAGNGTWSNSFGSATAVGKSYYSVTAGGTASWEIDVFGKLRRQAEAARAQYASTEEARRGVWITVLSDVGQNYFQLRSLDIQRNIAERTVVDRAAILEVFRVRAEGGIGTDLDVARAEADLAGANATLASLNQQIATTEDAISLLLGRSPGPIRRPLAPQALPPPPAVPAGLPSALLERRPDVRQAEADLVAANAQVGVATASLFPTFSLTSFGGFVSTSLNFLGAPNPAGLYSLGGDVSWLAPILKGSSLRYDLQAAKANWAGVRTAYIQTAISALRDVADSLVTLARLSEQRAYDEKQVAALKRALDVARTQFEGGTATYLDVINAEQQRFPAELALAQLEGNQLAAFVQLYRALGGGWWLGDTSSRQAGAERQAPTTE
jgi:multidrug efflux system outer membrane protein